MIAIDKPSKALAMQSLWKPEETAYKKDDEGLSYFCMERTGLYGDVVKCKGVDKGYDCTFHYNVFDPRDQKYLKRSKRIGDEPFVNVVGAGTRTIGIKNNVIEIESDVNETRCIVVGKKGPSLLCSHPSKMTAAERDLYACP